MEFYKLFLRSDGWRRDRLRVFDRDVVLFRTRTGRVGLLDARCPHMGVELGAGGTVDGELLRCPLHGWGFDAFGWCRAIPYMQTLPPICHQRPLTPSYRLNEVGGVIWAKPPPDPGAA